MEPTQCHCMMAHSVMSSNDLGDLTPLSLAMACGSDSRISSIAQGILI